MFYISIEALLLCIIEFIVLEIISTIYLTANIRGLVVKGKLTQDKADQALLILKGALDYSDFKDMDMVIEVNS